MVNRATSRSLLVVDEFGKGTAPADGLGLLAAALRGFAAAAPTAPRLLACTHFNELYEPEVLPRCGPGAAAALRAQQRRRRRARRSLSLPPFRSP